MDTATVIVAVEEVDRLRRLQVNRLVALQSDPGTHLIGIVQRITRKSEGEPREGEDDPAALSDDVIREQNLVRVVLIGTLFDKRLNEDNVFTRTLHAVPRIHAACFALEDRRLTNFMRVLARLPDKGTIAGLALGHYTLDEEAEAFLHGDKFFQRHALIVGSTGSGKSWTVARILEQISHLPSGNAIVFDLHGEYEPLRSSGFYHLRVAGPADVEAGRGLSDGVIYLPYWLLAYEALIPLLVDRSDVNAPNQAVVVADKVSEAKQRVLANLGRKDLLADFTIDSPIPFDIEEIGKSLRQLDLEMVPGARSEKQGPYHGKLTRLIARLENKVHDRRLGFLFGGRDDAQRLDYLDRLAATLLSRDGATGQPTARVKIIDFSEVPSDVLPLMVSMVARLIFSVQQWSPHHQRNTIAIFCDESQNYIPDREGADATADASVRVFEKIAREGRKYGVSLILITQRPSEVNRTILSQCNNVIAMRLTNAEDQSRVKALLPDSLGGFGDLLPVLDTGEALVVGDASLLPSRIRVSRPSAEPRSGTVPFWERWSAEATMLPVSNGVENWRRQSMTCARSSQ